MPQVWSLRRAGGQAPGNCSRAGRDTLARAAGAASRRRFGAPRDHRSHLTKGAHHAAHAGSRGSCRGAAPSPACAGSARTSCRTPSTKDVPGAASADGDPRPPRTQLRLAWPAWSLMGIALLFFATAVRNLLRSGEAREATYSSVAYGGWIVVVAGLSQMVMWSWGLINGAADAKDDAAAAHAGLRGVLRLGRDGDRPGDRLHRHGSGRHAQRGAAEVVRDPHGRLRCAGRPG